MHHEDSIQLSKEILDHLSIHDIMYAEIAESGAMGNDGGIILLICKNNFLISYETNFFDTHNVYTETREFVLKHQNSFKMDTVEVEQDLFEYHYGGVGNHVFINKKITLRDRKNYFTFHLNNKEYKIFCSFPGVYNCVRHSLYAANNQ